MILRQATIKYSGVDPSTLTKGSHKRVCVVCDGCGRVRWQKFKSYRNLCLFCSRKRGEDHHMYGIHRYGKDALHYGYKHTDESKEKNKLAHLGKQCGKDNPFYGHKHSDETLTLIKETLVHHHYIYDESDLSKYTILMSRSKHTTLHNNMRKAEIKIPHINIR